MVGTEMLERKAVHKFRAKPHVELEKNSGTEVIYVVHQDAFYKGFLMASLNISNLP